MGLEIVDDSKPLRRSASNDGDAHLQCDLFNEDDK